MNQISRKSFPTFKIYTNVTSDFGYNKCYEILNTTYKSYKTKFQAGHDTIYEIELNLIPDGFIEDMSLWGAKNIEIIQEEQVLSDKDEVYKRTTIYSCLGDPPIVKILESCNSSINHGTTYIKLIINGRWDRKK